MKDGHSTIRTLRGIDPQAIGTTGTGKTGKVIDTQGYGGVEFVNAIGSITATNATIVATLMEGDVTSTMTSVADADMLPMTNGEALAGVGQASTRTSGVSKLLTTRIGYKGNKRYVQLNLKSTVTAGPVISSVAVLHTPNVAPTPNP